MLESNMSKVEKKTSQSRPHFDIASIYLKECDIVASPRTKIDPGNATPTISINFSIESCKLDEESIYEVVFELDINSKIEDKTLFNLKLKQAGSFFIVGIPENQIDLILEVTCPGILLPYAREVVSDLVAKAGFPLLLLSPIDFELAYYKKKEQQAKNEEKPT